MLRITAVFNTPKIIPARRFRKPRATALTALYQSMVENDKNALQNTLDIIHTLPGIEDVNLVMTDGYTSGRGMGYGLPGAKRLVDKFEISSELNEGTIVRVMKWK